MDLIFSTCKVREKRVCGDFRYLYQSRFNGPFPRRHRWLLSGCAAPETTFVGIWAIWHLWRQGYEASKSDSLKPREYIHSLAQATHGWHAAPFCLVYSSIHGKQNTRRQRISRPRAPPPKSSLQGLLEVKDTHCPRTIRWIYAEERRTFPGAARVLSFE